MWVPDNILKMPDSRFGVAENKLQAPQNDLGLPGLHICQSEHFSLCVMYLPFFQTLCILKIKISVLKTC